MLARRADDRVGEQLAPQPQDGAEADAAVVRQALAEGEHHLALVVVAELAWIEAEEQAIESLGEGGACHG